MKHTITLATLIALSISLAHAEEVCGRQKVYGRVLKVEPITEVSVFSNHQSGLLEWQLRQLRFPGDQDRDDHGLQGHIPIERQDPHDPNRRGAGRHHDRAGQRELC